MKKILFIIILTLFISYSFAENIIVQTKSMTYVLDPDHGAHIISAIDEEGTNYVGKDNFLLLDLCTQQDYQQGDLKFAPYTLQKEETPTETILTLKAKFSTREAEGVELEKQLTFKKTDDIIYCKYTLTNPTDQNKKIGLWIQNIASPGDGTRTSFRPSTKGTVEFSYPLFADGYDPKTDFTFNFTQGFIGVINKEIKKGVAFLPDYNWLKCVYSNQGGFTQEWWYSDTLIKPAGSFSTEFKVIPFQGLERIDYASDNYFMAKEIKRDGNLAIFSTKTLSIGDYENKTIKITAKKYPDMKIIGETEGKLTGKFTDFELKMDNLNPKDDIVYNVYFPDTNEEYEAFSPGVAVLFTETDYKIKPPKRVKNIVKPEFKTRTINNKLNIIEARGLFADKYLFKEASKNKFDYTDALYYSNELGAGLKGMPEDYEEIFKYDLIIFNHIPYNAFTEDNWDLYKDYVNYGGKILFIGGPMTITGFDPDEDISGVLLPFSYRDFSKIKKVNKKLEEIGEYEYEVVLNTEGLTKITDYLYRKDIGDGALYFFTPTVLSQKKEAEGFWNNSNYIDFAVNMIENIGRGNY